MLANQTIKHSETILVYSGKSERTLRLARSWGVRIVLFDKPRFSHPAAFNAGARVARGEYLVSLSADAVPAHDRWLESLLHDFWCPSVAGVYGRHLLRPGHNWLDRWRIGARYGDQALCKWAAGGHVFSNANSAIRRTLWERHNFDESLTSGCEDYEWARWAHANGFALVYEPQASVFHTHGERYRSVPYLLRMARFKLIRWQIDARARRDVPGLGTPCPCPVDLPATAECVLRRLKDQPRGS